jgi:3-phenylpropionate/cinnamic acid dioxygenase small subunit
MADAKDQITALVYRYCELFDTGQFDEFAAQFEHGQWHRAGPGAAAARRWIDDHVHVYDGLPRTRHVTTNLTVQVDEEAGTASARSYITVLQARPDFPLQPIFAGRYLDTFTRVDGCWRWARREVIGDLYGDVSHHVRRDSEAEAVRGLADRQEIAELCARYTTALDTRDWDLLESCFTPKAAFVHPGGRLEGFPAILDRTRTALARLTATQHLLGNIVAEVDGDTARSVCYFQAQHVRAGTPGGETYIIAGRYADTLTRTADGWKITERVQAYLWRDGNRAVVAR